MNEVPKKFFRPSGFFAHIIGIPAFVLGFLLLFWPSGLREIGITFSEYSFHVTMIACIVLVVMLIARIVMMVLWMPPWKPGSCLLFHPVNTYFRQ